MVEKLQQNINLRRNPMHRIEHASEDPKYV